MANRTKEEAAASAAYFNEIRETNSAIDSAEIERRKKFNEKFNLPEPTPYERATGATK